MNDENRLKKLEQTITSLKETISSQNEDLRRLRKKNRLLSQILQEIPIPTFVIDPRHVITHYNKALEELTGISAGEIVGTKNQWKAFYKKKRPVMADLLVDGAGEETIKKFYNEYYHHSDVAPGSYEAEGFFDALGEEGKWLFFTATPLKDKEGKIIGGIETLQDITDRKQAEENVRRSEKKYKSLLDFSPYPIVVYDLCHKPIYLNDAFTRIFGWTMENAKDQRIPFSPKGSHHSIDEDFSKIEKDQGLSRQITQRLTRDGRVLDVVLRAATFLNAKNEPAGKLVIFRDITTERRLARDNEAMLRISLALPSHPDLNGLLDYIGDEIRVLLGTEGALVILQDEETGELYFKGASYDDPAIEEKVRGIRFSTDQIAAGRVMATGETLIVNDTSTDLTLFPERDIKLGYQTRNLIEVPLRGKTEIIGALAAINKKEGDFEEADIRRLHMIATTVALSIENASFSDALKKSFDEVKSLNRAKDKAINHLSHELRTPVSTLTGVLELLQHELSALPEENWKSLMEITQRNLTRIVDIQEEVADIMYDTHHAGHGLLNAMVDSCYDFIEVSLKAYPFHKDDIASIRKRIEDYFGPREDEIREVQLDLFVRERLAHALKKTTHRKVIVTSHLDPVPPMMLPVEALRKIVDGLVKNAYENTPDEGGIHVYVRHLGEGAELIVEDHGVGIIEDARQRIFEGFFATQDMMFYSTKTPYDFNAGGKGADLLRMKIFAERYHFSIRMQSRRCVKLPLESNVCPGKVSVCSFVKENGSCRRGSGSVFSVFFPGPEGKEKNQPS